MELYRALGFLIEAPTPGHDVVARALGLPPVPGRAEHASWITFQRYPYASVYLGEEGMLGGDARDRIAGFWLALGLEVPGEPDHLAALLSLLANLVEEETSAPPAPAALLRGARRTLLWEHLISWTTPWLATFGAEEPPFYHAWARLLARVLAQALEEVGRPDHLPPALVDLRPLGDPRRTQGGAGFLRALLAPGRSGLVMLRDDLGRAATDLGLALRAGERHYVLSALMAQDPAGTLAWLHRFAEAWCEGLDTAPGRRHAVHEWWTSRARGTAALLKSLAEDPAVLRPLAS